MLYCFSERPITAFAIAFGPLEVLDEPELVVRLLILRIEERTAIGSDTQVQPRIGDPGESSCLSSAQTVHLDRIGDRAIDEQRAVPRHSLDEVDAVGGHEERAGGDDVVKDPRLFAAADGHAPQAVTAIVGPGVVEKPAIGRFLCGEAALSRHFNRGSARIRHPPDLRSAGPVRPVVDPRAVM